MKTRIQKVRKFSVNLFDFVCMFGGDGEDFVALLLCDSPEPLTLGPTFMPFPLGHPRAAFTVCCQEPPLTMSSPTSWQGNTAESLHEDFFNFSVICFRFKQLLLMFNLMLSCCRNRKCPSTTFPPLISDSTVHPP